MPKVTSSRAAAAAARRHNPLAEDIITSGHLRTQSSKKSKRQGQQDEDGEDGERYIDAKMTRKILQIGQELAEEDAAEHEAAMGAANMATKSAFDFESRFEDDEALSDDDEKFREDQWGDEEEEIEEVVSGLRSKKYNFRSFNNFALGG
jgi:essential nuclear protein 1